MLKDLQLRDFRCFKALRVDFDAGFNFIVGGNGEGKTSVLEAACVLLRLQSQRSASLAPIIHIGAKQFLVRGHDNSHAMEFRYSPLRRWVKFDEADQRSHDDYLRVARVVSFANTDIELVRGSSDVRRRYVDFIGAQILPTYRQTLRSYERALRSRNALLKQLPINRRAIIAYDQPLVEHGTNLRAMRRALVARLAPKATAAYRSISGDAEALDVDFVAGHGDDFAADLSNSEPHETRLRQTVVGSHRDDIDLHIEKMPAASYASEGQQRTVALALKQAQAQMFAEEYEAPPLLLIDDVFGELDLRRRNALIDSLPLLSQKLVTATALSWRERVPEGALFHLDRHQLTRA